jgi:hypothetical protein
MMKFKSALEGFVFPADRVHRTVGSRRPAPGYARGLRLLQVALPGLLLTLACLSSAAQTSVLTYHDDTSRSGLVNETLLTPSNVNSKQFGKLFSYSVDGFVVAEPLYVPNVSIPGSGTHNVVYVVTQHDSVFAFDADTLGTGVPLWQVSLINSSAGLTTVPISVQGCKSTGYQEVGIMGTPVIDPATGTLFVSAKTMQASGTPPNVTHSYAHTLHALDITTGLEKFGGPLPISGSVTAPNGNVVSFEPLQHFQRPALLLSNGVVYVAFGSNGCDFNAYGWLFAFDSGETSGTLQQLAIYNTSPNVSYGASIWQTGSGPAADSTGNVFLMTANGTFDFSTGGPDLGDSFLKLDYSSGAFALEDYFTPDDQGSMAANDKDLGSGGVLLLPDQSGTNPHLLVGAGKTGTIYLVNRDSMGGYDLGLDGGNGNLQYLPGAVGPMYSTPVYWNNQVYFAANNDGIKGFSLTNGQLSTSPIIFSSKVGVAGVPSLSANGATNGLLWIPINPAKPFLAAYDATSLVDLYSSNQNPGRDGLGSFLPHFITPMIANGKVYVGTQSGLVVYGLFPSLSTTGGANQSGAVGTTLPLSITVQAVNSLGVGVPGVVVNFNDGGKGGTFSNPNATTDGTGTATTAYTLPTKAQTVTITASTSGYTPSSLKVTALPGSPTAIGLLSGGNQTGTAGQPLPLPIVVRLRDQYNNGVIGLQVSFSANPAGGGFSVNPVTTGTNGQASVVYTLSTTPGKVIVTASYSTLKININETGQ